MPPDDESQDPPVDRLTNMLIINALKKGASHLRVREGIAIEERHSREWRDAPPGALPPALWTPIVERLKTMANIDPGAVTVCGARVRLILGRREGSHTRQDFDVTLARTPTGTSIVLYALPVPGPDLPPAPPDAGPKRSEAEAQLTLATAAAERGDHDAVRRGLREAVDAASAMGAGSEGHAASFLRNAASVALSVGHDEDVIDLLERVLRLRASLGPADPGQVVDVELQLGSAYGGLARFDEAQPHLERAMEAAEAFGPENGLVVLALSAAGRGCARRGDLARAERLLERAEAVAEVLVGKDSSILVPRLELARVRRERDAAAAADSTRQVLALAESYGDDWITVQALGDLAEASQARGAAEAACEYSRRALALTGSHPRALHLHAMLARVLSGQDRRSEALVVLRAAAEIARACRAPAHPDRVAIEGELALAERSSPYR